MEIVYSNHWLKKSLKKRKDITNDLIEYTILNSKIINDKEWENVFNAISQIPQSGRILKVVYRRINHNIYNNSILVRLTWKRKKYGMMTKQMF